MLCWLGINVGRSLVLSLLLLLVLAWIVSPITRSWAASVAETPSALDHAREMQSKVQAQTNEALKKADILSTTPEFIEALNQEASKLMQHREGIPSPTFPNLPELSAEQLDRARFDIGKLLDQAQDQENNQHRLFIPVEKTGLQLYIFVSFSMPDITLKRLLSQANRIDASLILRGLYEESLSKTKEKITELLEADAMGKTKIKGGLAIDPTLFERFNITQVPTFVLTHTPAQRCSETGCPNTDYARFSGDTTIEYILQTMAREAPEMRQSAQILLKKIRGGS